MYKYLVAYVLDGIVDKEVCYLEKENPNINESDIEQLQAMIHPLCVVIAVTTLDW